MKIRLTVLTILCLFCVISCKSKFHIPTRNMPNLDCESCSSSELVNMFSEHKLLANRIILINDSVLEYIKLFYDCGWNSEIKYKIVENELIIDTIDTKKRSTAYCNMETVEYYTDSLRNIKTGEKFYSENYYSLQIREYIKHNKATRIPKKALRLKYGKKYYPMKFR
ncbi:MAG: hypothetical protein LBV75_01735 [Paludibacter sp.]|nr:hypothetical protein [Paludibacter sp.]